MKKITKISAFLLTAAMLMSVAPLTGFAYGKGDQRLTITHINTQPSYEGAAIICSGELYSMFGTLGTFAWWKTVVFDWNAEEKVYKVVDVQTNAANFDKSHIEIPKTGFLYAVCRGNNYPGGINYVNKPASDSMDYINDIKVGDTAYLYGADLANGIVQNNGKLWYSEDFVSDSFIKIGAPIDGMEAYDPEVSRLLSIDITPNMINNIDYAVERSIIMTDKNGRFVDYNGSGNFEWWNTVVFDWDDSERCYVVASASRAVGNSNSKQPIIPENGFVLLDCGANTTSISNLKIGTQCWLYDIDLEKGTLGKAPLIRANVPDKDREAFIPSCNSPRLNAPEINECGPGRHINTPDTGITLTWDAINEADGYVIAINDAAAVADGMLIVKPTVIYKNSYTIPESILSAGKTYTIWIYAVADGHTSSMVNCYTVKCLSEIAMNSSLVNKKVIAFGDSLTARTGYVSMLYGYIGTNVINAGVGGNTTVHAKERFKQDVLDKDPDVVLICFGMNDQACNLATIKPNVSLDVYRSNIEYFAKTLTDAGKDVVFVVPSPACTAPGYYSPGAYSLDYSYGFVDDFCNAMRQVAIKYDCGLVDIKYECEFEDMTQFLIPGDGIHQSVYGHTRYAELISDYLLAEYDGVDKATMTVNCVDEKGNTLKTVTYTGKKDSHITLAVPEIEGATCASDDIKTVFTDGKTFTFTYTSNGPEYVKGDVNGDGKINATDYTLAKRHVLKTWKLEGVDLAAADVNGDGKVNATDYVLIKRHVLKTYKIQ